MAHHRVQQWMTFSRQWWLYDAKWQCPFKSAPIIVKHLMGAHKPIFHPKGDFGDVVVAFNTRHIAMKNETWRTHEFLDFEGYAGLMRGYRVTKAYKLHEHDPTRVFYRIVYSSFKSTLEKKGIMAKLHLYPDENIPEDVLKNITGCIPQVMPSPRRLHEYTEEEKAAFPRLFKLSEDHIVDLEKYVYCPPPVKTMYD